MAQDLSLEKVPPSIPLDFLNSLKKAFLPFKIFENKYYVMKCNNGNVYVYELSEENQEGEGGFGQVYAGYQIDVATGQCAKKVAIKSLSEFEDGMLKREIAYLDENGFNPEPEAIKASGKAYIVMDFAYGKELNIDEFLAATEYSLSEAVNLVWQLSATFNKMHHDSLRARATVHSDIKPGNIRVLVDNKKLKDVRVVDFGLAAKVKDDQDSLTANNIGGTPEYAAPETKTKKREHGPKSDIYSFGLILQEMFGKINLPDNLKPIITAFVQQMHTHEYDVRPNSDEVLRFFNSVNNYLKADEAQKAERLEAIEMVWVACAKNVEKLYIRSQIIAFLHVLNKHESFREYYKVLVETLSKSLLVKHKLALFLHLSEQKKKQIMQATLAEDIAKGTQHCSGEEVVLFLRAISHDKHITKVVLQDYAPKRADDSLCLFIHLSKRQYSNDSKEKWLECVERVSQHRHEYSPKTLLIILRKLNTHESEYKERYKQKKDVKIKTQLDNIKAAKNTIAAVLTQATEASTQGKCFLSAERFAARKLNYAVTGSFTFFNDYRAKRILKDATKTQKDERIVSIVRQLKVGI